MAAKIAPCPNCNSNQLYQSEPVSAGGGHAPNYLPGLGSFFRAEQFQLVVCRDCGLARFLLGRKRWPSWANRASGIASRRQACTRRRRALC